MNFDVNTNIVKQEKKYKIDLITINRSCMKPNKIRKNSVA